MSTPVAHFPALAAEAVGALVDQIAVLDRMESSVAAMKAQLIDQTRQLSEVLELSVTPIDANAWSATETVRRILASELACALRLPERTAETLISDSDVLVNSLPATLDALSHGHISWRHAHVIADHAQSLPLEARAEFEQHELPFAKAHTATRLNRHARIEREKMQPETIDERHVDAVATRSIDFQPARDGMAWITAFLPTATAIAIFDRIDRAAASARSAEEPRTLGQLRADVFADVLLGEVAGVAEGDADAARFAGPPALTGLPDLARLLGRIRPQVQVTVPVLTLLDHGDEPAMLEDYGPIDIETALLLASHAPNFIRLLTHPETGTVLSVGRDRYTVPEDLRRWLRTRDGTCRFPGCGRAAKRCDLDHTDDWHYGGDTAHDNLAHLCRAHHRLKHLTDWKVEQVGDGELRWTSPLGRVYLTAPATRMVQPGTSITTSAKTRAVAA
jgi:hypothetical protein